MKIHIIGGGGSGKSTLTKRLEKENNIPTLTADPQKLWVVTCHFGLSPNIQGCHYVDS